MKNKKIIKVMIIAVLCITLPMAQAFAIVPDSGSIFKDSNDVESSSETETTADTSSQPVNTIDIPVGDLFEASAVIPGEESIEVLEADSSSEDEDEELVAAGGFWNGKKIVIAGSVLLTTGLVLGLLLLLAGGGGGGSESGGGGGGGSNGGFVPEIPFVPFETGSSGNPGSPVVPHHPEPASLILMGLGLLVPLLRKKS